MSRPCGVLDDRVEAILLLSMGCKKWVPERIKGVCGSLLKVESGIQLRGVAEAD